MINYIKQKGIEFCFYKFVHNCFVHPLMSLPLEEPQWLNKLHDYTAKKCWGAG